MDVVQLQEEFISIVKALFAEGMLDDQFKVIQGWTSDEIGDPSFAIEVINNYLSASASGLDNIDDALSVISREQAPNLDFKQLSTYAHKINEASCWVGAPKILNLCHEFQRCCEEKKINGCFRSKLTLETEVAILNGKLENVVKLELDIMEANGKVPAILD